MQDFPSNSQKAKEPLAPKEKIQKVTSAETVRRKRGLGRQFKETFIAGDTRSAAEHVMFDVIVPTMKDMLFDAFESGLRSLIFGDSVKKGRRPGVGSGYDSLGTRVSYNSISSPTRAAANAPQTRTMSRQARARHDFNDLIIATRAEAEEVLDRMFDLLNRYGVVHVSDLYELTDVQSSHTDMKWGWHELPGAKVLRLRNGGFLLDLPDPEPLN